MTVGDLGFSANHDHAPRVSVVLPVYNGEKYLAEAIESVLTQTFVDFELIVVDDGSIDDSPNILLKYQDIDPRVRVVVRENKGLPATLNDSIDMARGEWIVRMDQDDICSPERLACQYEYMQQHPDVVVLGSAANFMDAEGHVLCTYLPPVDDDALRRIFPSSPFIHPSVIFRKDNYCRAGKYPEKMKWGGEDVVFFGRLAGFGKLHNLRKALVNYRLVPGSMSRKPPVFRKMLIDIVASEIAGKPATDQQLLLLQQESTKIDKSQALFDYHFEMAKLCIWSGRSRENAMRYLAKCLVFRPVLVKVIFMGLLALMPHNWTRAVFFRLKGRHYE
ncbi:MAG: glycosyltransferase [Gallionella sp.]|nr:glycosyltransferase [Gallionella sp.]